MRLLIDSFKLKLLAILVLCIAALAASAVRCAEPIITKSPNFEFEKIAHRGAKKFAPENTIPAIEKAIEIGFDYVELDVRYTNDGIPICMHDERVNRTTNGEGYVKDFTAEEITKLDASVGFVSDPEKFKGTHVPTLEQALQAMQGKIKLYMDQKEPPNELSIELLRKYDFLPDNMVVVGGLENNLAFRELAPDSPAMPPGKDLEEMKATLELFGNPYAFNVTCPNVDEEMIEFAHSNGVRVFLNTLGWCDQPMLVEQMINLGPDAIQTDHPIQLMKVMKSMKKKGKKKKKD